MTFSMASLSKLIPRPRAQVFSTAFTACAVFVTHLGLGRHAVLMKDPAAFAKVHCAIFLMNPTDNALSLKAIIAKEVVYNPAIVAIKTSILLLYRRIFIEKRSNKPFNTCLWCTGAFVLAYSVVQAILTVFHCAPVKALWDSNIERSCINFDDVLIVLSSLNIGTDVVILCLPIPQLWRLEISKRRRLQLIAMFLLGGL